jgi:glycine/D-amino acid oxidase-like deaminating enzyme
MMTGTVPSRHGPTWYAATAVAAPERPALTHDLDVDLCVIGAGLAGLTVAREVARRGWSVAVLEADCVAGGASGRNAGFVSPGFAEGIEAIVERVGPSRAKELWGLSNAGVAYVRGAIAENAMPGVDPHDGRLSVRRTNNEPALIEHAAMLRVDFGADVEAWPVEQVREVLRSPMYFQALHFPTAFHIHPLNYALGLAAAAEADGARIFQGTRALSVDPAGVRKRVQTERHMLRARHVVLAGSTGTGAVDQQLADTVQPIATYLAVTAPLGERLFEAVRYTGAIADTRRAGDYYRVVADDRLMWGGRITTRLSEPRKLKALMRHDMLDVYPQLGDVEIAHAWAGTMAYAVHKMPQIGELAPGYWLASAFGGHGLNTTAMAGEMIARAILDGDDRWRLFSSYELVWAGGKAGRMAAQAIYWSMQARDSLQEKIARYRDEARREADARHARWDADKAARIAAQAALRAEEEARHIAEAEAKRVAALKAAQLAAERARQREDRLKKEEQARQVAAAAERAADEARRATEDIERAAAEKFVRDAANALARQIEEHKALTAVVTPASAGEESGMAETAIGGSDSPPGNVEATAQAVEPRPPDSGHAPTLEEAMSAPAPVAELFDPGRKGTTRKPRKKKDDAPAG